MHKDKICLGFDQGLSSFGESEKGKLVGGVFISLTNGQKYMYFRETLFHITIMHEK